MTRADAAEVAVDQFPVDGRAPRAAAAGSAVDRRAAESSPVAGAQHRFSRRGFLRLCGGGLLGVGTMGAYAHFGELHWVAVEQIEMDLPGLAPDWNGLRILQLSDLHVSAVVAVDFLRREMDHCNALQPDVIVFTGDFITRADPRYLPTLTELLGRLRAPLGIFAVLGNHDYGVYKHFRRFGAPADTVLEKPLEDCGVRVLRNAMHPLEAHGRSGCVQLVGVDDWWTRASDPQRAFAQVNPAEPCILLTHNPDTLAVLRQRPWHWMLCGHTHGGQVRIPLLGAPILPLDDRKYDAGLFELAPSGPQAGAWRQRIYVNRGLGHLMPVRFNCRPEITVFTLRSA